MPATIHLSDGSVSWPPPGTVEAAFEPKVVALTSGRVDVDAVDPERGGSKKVLLLGIF